MRSTEGLSKKALERPSPAGRGRRLLPRGRAGRLGAAVLVALIVAGCLLQVALALRDDGNYGAVSGQVPDWCVPAATARALGLGDAALCPPPGPAQPRS